MNIIIQKFGGTSVSTQDRREMVADKIVNAIEKGFSPVIVVSAIGRKGDPYATDTLLSLVNGNKCHIDNRELDILLSCGEIISAVVMAETLEKRGFNARVLSGGQAGIITDRNFNNANIIKFDDSTIMSTLTSNIIPIVAGFQGMTENGDVTTLGRGASDITATFLGEGLRAKLIEIYTDVDGIMTADPLIVKDAKVIDKISYNEVFQFADQGAKVINSRALEYAMRSNIPVVIKNTMSDAKGTTICSAKDVKPKIITGITHMSNRTQITADFEKEDMNNDNLFDLLAENNISIDLINVFPNYKVFTIDDDDGDKVEKLLNDLNMNFTIIKNCSKVAVIGNGMRGTPGVMAKILKVLRQNNIKVLQTADSHTTIWCLINGKDTVKAINALHDSFTY